MPPKVPIFSLLGLGEPIRQIREFIKDVWYRNAHERQMAELERLKNATKVVEYWQKVRRKSIRSRVHGKHIAPLLDQ